MVRRLSRKKSRSKRVKNSSMKGGSSKQGYYGYSKSTPLSVRAQKALQEYQTQLLELNVHKELGKSKGKSNETS